MVRKPTNQRLTCGLLALAFVCGNSALCAQERPAPPGAPNPGGKPPPPAELLRLTRNIPGDSKPIVIEADEVATWLEPGQRLVLIRGQVLVEQGIVQARFQQGVVWIDLDNYKRSGGLLRVQVYGETQVQVENGTEVQNGARVLLDLTTRGELKLSSYRNRVLQQSLAADPLVGRGVGARGTPAPLKQAPPSTEQVIPTGRRVPSPQGGIRSNTGQVTYLSFYGPPPPGGGPAAGLTDTTSPSPPAAPPPGTVPAAQPPKPLDSSPAAQAGFASPADVPAQDVPPSTSRRAPPEPAPTPAVELPPPRRENTGPPLPPPSQQTPRPPGSPAAAFGGATPFTVTPRTGTGFNVKYEPLGNGLYAAIVNGGVIINVRNVRGIGLLDIEGDRLVIFTRSNSPPTLFNAPPGAEGEESREVEFYLSGNVEIRQQDGPQTRTLRASEVYYDVKRTTAIALGAQLEIKPPPPAPGKPVVFTDDVIIRSDELQQLAANQYQVIRADIFSSRLPSDPGLKVYVTQATIEDKDVPVRSLFGRPVVDRATGRPETEKQTLFKGTDLFLEYENVPFFYFPYLSGNARDPLGPIEDVTFGYNRIFGFQTGVTLNVFDLLGVQPPQNMKWRASFDYLSSRGPALGSTFDYAAKEIFTVPAKVDGFVKAYGIYDQGFDDLGGGRGGPGTPDYFQPDGFRGRLTWRQGVYDLPDGFTVQLQFSALSDRNFLEQYFKNEFDQDINQETFLYVKQQQGNWAWTGLVEPNLRTWVTETQSLPRADGFLLGQSFFNLLTYNAHASAGYFHLRTSSDGEPPVSPTDVNDRTGRFDLMQEVSAPFALGPVKVVPYATLDLTEYTRDLNGNENGRVYGGGGVRASMPLTRLYPDVKSLLFNLDGLNHKVVLSANYYYAESNEPHTLYPQLDRLNDDATDQALRDFRPVVPYFNPSHGLFLVTSPLYDPQVYANRRLLETSIDTLDTIDVLQLDIRQRLQTKRGYPGAEHIVDWMILDVSASYFPNAGRDNFNEHWAFLEYDYLWNLGDRTALTSTGWLDPIDNGPRVFTVGAFLNRPDRTNFYLGYRLIEPIQSRAVTGAATYVFSPKYGMTFSTTYDFGNNKALSSSLVFTRIGSDVQVSLGFSYNALQNNFGFLFEIVPNLVPANRRSGLLSALGPGGLGR